jgi:O-succinylbenzoic acid--CoA ligase
MNTAFLRFLTQFQHLDFFQSEKIAKTYFEFHEDIKTQATLTQKNYPKDLRVVVKNSDQYLFLVEIFAVWFIGKIPILLSTKETTHSEQILLNQVGAGQNSANNEALVLFSSGSTGTPKGISLTFENLLFQAQSFHNLFASTLGEIYFLNLPLNHIGGLMVCMRAFFSGGKISTTKSLPFSYISLVPLQLDLWIKNTTMLDSLLKAKAILIGGAPLRPSLKEKALSLQLPIYETYGMTETTSFVAINGRILTDREMRLASDGTVLIKGPMLAAGYYLGQTFHPIPEWFETSDLGFFDEEKNFHPNGRKNSFLISGGENINPHVIEKIALEIEDIQEVYAVGIPDEKWGDLVVLLYKSTEDNTRELKNILTKKLHPYHLPKFFLKTNFASTDQLKVTRPFLNELAYELFLKNIFSHSYTFTSCEKPTMVVLHGFMENKDDWEFLSKRFSSTHNILTIDLPGHGKTELTYFSSLHEILTRLRDFILLFSRKPIFLGYSMGGRIALRLSEDYLTPEKLILISASQGLTSALEQQERFCSDLKLFDKINETYSLKNFFTEWYSAPMFRPYYESANFKSDIEEKSKGDFKSWARSLKYFSQGNFPLKRVPNLSCPVFYISGSADKKYSMQNVSHNHLTIEGAGHNPHKTHVENLCHFCKMALAPS